MGILDFIMAAVMTIGGGGNQASIVEDEVLVRSAIGMGELLSDGGEGIPLFERHGRYTIIGWVDVSTETFIGIEHDRRTGDYTPLTVFGH